MIIRSAHWERSLDKAPELPKLVEAEAKIDRLMALCDRPEQQIDAATDKRTELFNALMVQI